MKWKLSKGIWALGVLMAPCITLGQVNSAPKLADQSVIGTVGHTTTIGIDVMDADPNNLNFTTELMNTPTLGTVKIQNVYTETKLSNSAAVMYRITPKLVYTATKAGIEKIQYRVSDGLAKSNIVTARIFNRANLKSNAGLTVLLVIKSDIGPSLKVETDRLRADLISEGYFVKQQLIPALTSLEVWNVLNAESKIVGQNLSGVILIGRIPFIRNGEKIKASTNCPFCFSDYAYMNMQRYESIFGKSFWVSRFSTSLGMDQYGNELTLLRRALQANHDYRKSLSRLPNRGFYYDDVGHRNFTASILDVWASGEYLRASLAFPKGSEFLQETSHGGPSEFDSGAVTNTSIHSIINQARFAGIASCVSGAPGGVVNNQLFTRGGGNVMSYGSSATTYVGFNDIMDPVYAVDINFRSRLKAGDSMGGAFTDYDAFGDSRRGIIYGDFSVKARMNPHNEMPAVTSLTASKLLGAAPLTVSFTGAASDADGTIKNIEWFTFGHQFGRVAPSASGATVKSASATYQVPHNYRVRMEVEDNYKARAYKEVTVVVAPTPRSPLRIDVGGQTEVYAPPSYHFQTGIDAKDTFNLLWLHDQRLMTGGWGWKDFSNHRVKSLRTIAGTANEKLFQTYRIDYYRKGFVYTLPIGTGKFNVKLGFAELLNAAPNMRLINVLINDVPVLTNFDIYASVGADRAIIKSFSATAVNGMISVKVITSPSSPAGAKSVAILNTLEVLPVP